MSKSNSWHMKFEGKNESDYCVRANTLLAQYLSSASSPGSNFLPLPFSKGTYRHYQAQQMFAEKCMERYTRNIIKKCL